MARGLCTFLVTAVLAVPCAAEADAHACAGRSTPRWISRTTLGLSLVPFGAEIQARGGACFPLFPRDGDWFDLAMVEIGCSPRSRRSTQQAAAT